MKSFNDSFKLAAICLLACIFLGATVGTVTSGIQVIGDLIKLHRDR